MDILFQSLVSQGGLLGSLLVIALLALVYVFKLLLGEKDKRIQDATQVRDTIARPMAEIRESLEFIERKIKVSKGE